MAVNDPLLEAIADDLEIQTSTAGVYPPYVQMVGETLCEAAHEENESILTEELYRRKDGCKGIIGRYLLQRLAEFGEQEDAARRVLVALVRSTGVKDLGALEELHAETRLDAEPLTQLLAELVNKRVIRQLGDGQYEIIHDHLAFLVDREIVDDEQRQLKELREFLDLRARAYVTDHVPLQSPDMARLYKVREHILPNDDQMRLLLYSCLLGRGPAWFWLQNAQKAIYVSLLRDALVSPIAELRCNAISIIAQVAGSKAFSNLRVMVQDDDEAVRQAATKALPQVLQQMGREALPDLREMLKDQVGSVRRAAVELLAQVAGHEVLPDLREMLKDQDHDVWQAAMKGLVQVVDGEDVPDLREMLKDRVVGGVRRAMVEVLVRVVGREAIRDLREMLKDQDRTVRQAVAQALEELSTEDDLEELAEWAAHHWLTEGGKEATELLIHLDRKLYFPA